MAIGSEKKMPVVGDKWWQRPSTKMLSVELTPVPQTGGRWVCSGFAKRWPRHISTAFTCGTVLPTAFGLEVWLAVRSMLAHMGAFACKSLRGVKVAIKNDLLQIISKHNVLWPMCVWMSFVFDTVMMTRFLMPFALARPGFLRKRNAESFNGRCSPTGRGRDFADDFWIGNMFGVAQKNCKCKFINNWFLFSWSENNMKQLLIFTISSVVLFRSCRRSFALPSSWRFLAKLIGPENRTQLQINIYKYIQYEIIIDMLLYHVKWCLCK